MCNQDSIIVSLLWTLSLHSVNYNIIMLTKCVHCTMLYVCINKSLKWLHMKWDNAIKGFRKLCFCYDHSIFGPYTCTILTFIQCIVHFTVEAVPKKVTCCIAK